MLWSLFVIGCFTSIVNASIGIVEDDPKPPTRRIARTMCSDPWVNGEPPLQTLEVTPSVKKVSTFHTVFGIDIKTPVPFPQTSDVLVENSRPHSSSIQARSPRTENVGPPAPPPPAMWLSPPPRPERVLVTGSRCLDVGGFEIFEATLTSPEGYDAIPVFEDKPKVDPTTHHYCRMIPLQRGVYQLVVSRFEPCGVRRCGRTDRDNLYCLHLRIPLVQRVKLPEDELFEIRCRPHYRTAEETKVLSVEVADEGGM